MTPAWRQHPGPLLCWISFYAGLVLICSAGWIHIKARLAQKLLERAWQQSKAQDVPVLPWPWADSWPVARLQIASLDLDHIVLAGASGRNLAFGPVHVAPSSAPGQPGHVVISAHRDTHFQALEDVIHGAIITIEDRDGSSRYQVTHTEVIDLDRQSLRQEHHRHKLTLATCYPFNAIDTGTSQRFVVHATRLSRVINEAG